MDALCLQTIDSVFCGDLRNGPFPRVYDALPSDLAGKSLVPEAELADGFLTLVLSDMFKKTPHGIFVKALTSATATSTCQ